MLKRLVGWINEGGVNQKEAYKELKEEHSSFRREVLEGELVENGLEKEMAKFIVEKLATEWCDEYLKRNGFTKRNMEFLENTDNYKYVMKK